MLCYKRSPRSIKLPQLFVIQNSGMLKMWKQLLCQMLQLAESCRAIVNAMCNKWYRLRLLRRLHHRCRPGRAFSVAVQQHKHRQGQRWILGSLMSSSMFLGFVMVVKMGSPWVIRQLMAVVCNSSMNGSVNFRLCQNQTVSVLLALTYSSPPHSINLRISFQQIWHHSTSPFRS